MHAHCDMYVNGCEIYEYVRRYVFYVCVCRVCNVVVVRLSNYLMRKVGAEIFPFTG